MSVTVLAAQLCARVPGGTARYTRGLVEALAASADGRRQVTAAAPARCPAAAQLPVPVRTLPAPVLALSRLWERGLPPYVPGQVVHAPTLLVPPVRPAQRLVVTVHDTVPWTHPQTLTPRGVRFHQRMGERAGRHADLILTPTAAVAAAVVEVLAPRCPVRAVAPGTAALPVPADAGERRRGLGLSRPYVLFVGTAEPRKGLDVLVEAMGDPLVAGLDLVVVGPSGWGDIHVEDLARRAGVLDRTRVLGWVPDETLAAVYAGATVLAMPSRAEGFGLPVVEAMSHGVPVVVSDDPALVEVGGAAAYVSPIGDVGALADALAAAAAGEGRAQRADAGRSRSDKLTWAAAAAQLWSLYADLVGSGDAG